MDPQLLSALESKLDSVNIPTDADKVHKDECIYSFTTIKNSNNDGLYICLNKFWAFSRSHMMDYHKISGNALFLRIRKVKSSSRKSEAAAQSQSDSKEEASEQPPAKMIRKDSSSEDDYENQFEIVIMPDFQTVSLPNDELPQKIQDSIRAIQDKPSASVSDLLLEEDPVHLEMHGKQYTADDKLYQNTLQQPLIPDPIIVTNWRGRSNNRGNYNRNYHNRDRDHDRGWGRPGTSGGGGGQGNRSEGVRFHRPWR